MKAGIYQHYKGNFYQVLGIARHSETGERMVVYISLYANGDGPRMNVRPLEGPEGFTTPVEKVRIMGQAVPRFRYVGDEILPEGSAPPRPSLVCPKNESGGGHSAEWYVGGRCQYCGDVD